MRITRSQVYMVLMGISPQEEDLNVLSLGHEEVSVFPQEESAMNYKLICVAI